MSNTALAYSGPDRETTQYSEFSLLPDYKRPLPPALMLENLPENKESSATQDELDSSWQPQVPPTMPSRVNAKVLRHWEGRVDTVEGMSFIATIQDRTTSDAPPEEAEFSRDDVTPADRDLLRPGAIFYWSIGYENYFGRGTRRKYSELRFRRLLQPEPLDLQQRANNLAEFLAAHAKTT